MLSCFRGGGSFDLDGDGMKNGRWIDLSYGFKGDYQITYQGEYLKGNKVGRWDIYIESRMSRILNRCDLYYVTFFQVMVDNITWQVMGLIQEDGLN
ncbi:unnamed protein product [Paramecium primaurelia]|uniref:Uncharacterized protein n=1 Tax=Paramecium primaurelia TaxID=5886 RepID=A0A8S1LJ51_PARPR|nr:unnamed protein product [Paramecium primaurelia]